MLWQWTPYTIIPVVSSLLLIVTSIYILIYRKDRKETKYGAFILIACAEFIIAYLLEIISIDLEMKIFWCKAQYIGLVIASIMWFVYTIFYIGLERWFSLRNVSLISLLPILIIVLIVTNESHNLIWRDAYLDTSGYPADLEKTFGTGFYVMVLYLYFLFSVTIYLHIKLLIQSRRIYRWQALVLVCSVSISYFGAFMDVVKISPFPRFIATILGVSIGGSIIAFTISKVRKSDFLTLSRDFTFKSMKDGVIVLDDRNYVIDMNPSAKKIIGITSTGDMYHRIEEVWSDFHKWLEQFPDDTSTGKEFDCSINGSRYVFDVRISVLSDWSGKLISRVFVFRDVSERALAEFEIKRSLKEKEVLLKEIHHRVKNNLQTICSLLNLQASTLTDQKSLDVLMQSRNRVLSMALLHERLYQSTDVIRLQFVNYINSLMSQLYQSYGINADIIEPKVNISDITLSMDTTIICGLIFNEIVSNVFKHAFPNSRQGKVDIEFHLKDDSEYLFRIADNGIGLPDELDIRKSKSLGLQLINILVDQLDGRVEINRNLGTEFCIHFPKETV